MSELKLETQHGDCFLSLFLTWLPGFIFESHKELCTCVYTCVCMCIFLGREGRSEEPSQWPLRILRCPGHQAMNVTLRLCPAFRDSESPGKRFRRNTHTSPSPRTPLRPPPATTGHRRPAPGHTPSTLRDDEDITDFMRTSAMPNRNLKGSNYF